MHIQIFGAGLGRTGTHSLKLALNQLGLGPCYHMKEVIEQKSVRVPLWSAALNGKADWQTIFSGYQSAVDWPTTGFFTELIAAYPSAKFILTQRSPESWVDSFSETIYKLLAGRNEARPEIKQWLDMCSGVIAKTGFPDGLDRDALLQGFLAHNKAVKMAIPADQLLVYEVKQGWEPLCKFLEVPIPTQDFPRSNDRLEFWDLVSDKS